MKNLTLKERLTVKSKKAVSAVLALALIICIIPLSSPQASAATFNDINASEVFLKQPKGSVTCTLVAATMMMRRTAIAAGNSNWRNITPSNVASVAWYSGGLYYNFSYAGISVGHAYVNQNDIRGSYISLLKAYPQGVVAYNRGQPHAILLTDYDASTDTFYCADPSPYYASGRIPLSQSSITGSSQYDKLNRLTDYWYVKSPSVSLQPNNCLLDVNTIVDGKEYRGGYPGVTFDVRLDRTVVSNDVCDFCQDVKVGTYYAVMDINIPSGYVLTGPLDNYGNYYGRVDGDMCVNVSMVTPTCVKTAYFNGSKYEFYKVSTSWESAYKFANAMGGHLATITSQQEENFILANNPVSNCWLGASNLNATGTWKWVTGEPWAYTDWAVGEPNNSFIDGEHFLGFFGNKWNDFAWYYIEVNGFIVEYNHEHTWNSGQNKIPAKCASTGIKTYTCSCGATYNQTIPALGHKYATTTAKADIKKDGLITTKCKVCQAVKSRTAIPKVSSISLSKTAFTYNGKAQRPSVVVKDRTGKILKNGTDYTVKYSSGCKNVGQYSVTITFKGKYTGTKTLTFKIVPKGTSISKLTAGKKQFTAKWSAQTAQTTGYELQYSTSSSMSGAKTVTVGKNKTTSAKVKKLKGKKKYYVRVRTYKIVKINGKSVKLYSSWSKVKSVKTK